MTATSITSCSSAPSHRRQVTEGRRDHGGDREADAGGDALQAMRRERRAIWIAGRMRSSWSTSSTTSAASAEAAAPLAPMATPTSAAASAGRVVDAVADHHHRAVLALGQHHQDLLVGGELRAHRSRWTSPMLTKRATSRRSPVASTMRSMPSARKLRSSCSVPARSASAEDDNAGGLAVDRHRDADGAGRAVQAERAQGRRADLAGDEMEAADRDRVAVDRPVSPSPGVSTTAVGTVRVRPRSRAAATRVWPMMCLEAWSSEAAMRRTSSAVRPSATWVATMRASPLRQRAGLVEHQRPHGGERLDRLAALDQDAELGGARQAGDDGDRHRQDQRTGRRHHQHRHGADRVAGEPQAPPASARSRPGTGGRSGRPARHRRA